MEIWKLAPLEVWEFGSAKGSAVSKFGNLEVSEVGLRSPEVWEFGSAEVWKLRKFAFLAKRRARLFFRLALGELSPPVRGRYLSSQLSVFMSHRVIYRIIDYFIILYIILQNTIWYNIV